MQCFIGILVLIIGMMCGYIIGEAACMNTYTERLEKRQRAFEKRMMKKLEGLK